MKLSEFFQNAGTKQIVINTDIDGFLSGMLLCKYYDCEVVGFSDSRERIWLRPDIESLKEPVYIDIFINDPEVYGIDQHIVAKDREHAETIRSWGTKMNPNIDVCCRCFYPACRRADDFTHKYPFGTVHYLLALMEQDGVAVDHPGFNDIHEVVGIGGRKYKISMAKLMSRADDTLLSSLVKYKPNASDWWGYMKEFKTVSEPTTTTAPLIQKSIDYLNSFNPATVETDAENFNSYMAAFFQNGFGCDGIDGAFKDSITDGGRLKSKINVYNACLESITGIHMELPQELVEYRGTRNVEVFSDDKMSSSFTYAFVYGPSNANHFSYTVYDCV